MIRIILCVLVINFIMCSRENSFSEAEDNFAKYNENQLIEEKGNLHGIGRDIIQYLTNMINNTFDIEKKSFFRMLIEFKITFPGTQWCGEGNNADINKNLGFFNNTDDCCRLHDTCINYIEKSDKKYNLINTGLFIRSHCYCDRKFYNCLKSSNDLIANLVGIYYFTILGPQCFKKHYPKKHCRIQVGLTKRCIEFELDYTKPKIYQWFDNPEY